jgi:hypothetical protein
MLTYDSVMLLVTDGGLAAARRSIGRSSADRLRPNRSGLGRSFALADPGSGAPSLSGCARSACSREDVCRRELQRMRKRCALGSPSPANCETLDRQLPNDVANADDARNDNLGVEAT